MKPIIITIDGYCSCGKSTLARDLARQLNYKYVDTGAMYRAVTLYFLEHDVGFNDHEQIRKALSEISIDFSYAPQTGQQRTHLNGVEVERAIRQLHVSSKVSEVSAIGPVREKMVEQQQKFGEEKGIVMDGRDIGTVVFPNAEVKIFLTASESVRIKRRYDELIRQGKIVSIGDIRADIDERDYLDTHRQESPLKKAHDAYLLDNTHMTIRQQRDWVYDLAIPFISEDAKAYKDAT